MKKLILATILIAVSITSYAQVPSAALQVDAADKGFLLPRMPDQTVITAPAAGLQVYNTTTNKVMLYNGSSWEELTSGTETNTLLVDNLDGTFTYTSEDGTVTTFDAKIGTVLDNADGTFTVTDDFGTSVTIDSNDTLTSMVQDDTTGVITYTAEDAGTSTAEVVSTDANNSVTVGTDGGAYFSATTLDATDDAWINNAADGVIEVATLADGTTARPAGTEVVITDGGNVGIGITTPNAKLQINGDQDSGLAFQIRNMDTGVNANSRIALSSSASQLTFFNHGSGRTLTRFGQTLGGWAELQLGNSSVGTTNGLIIGTTVDKPILFGTNGNERVRISEDGNVGIGTITPGSKLSVVGLLEYADNIAATTAGLVVGDFYRTADGTVKVVF